ncbi:hypothetical protein TcWFU_010336 [Taenia crassiceps]|uniref:Uncharacterized protein n=1 Tax=Taenia crassiceps TaxID=6207 RepID=A0ABR4QCK8_9CEST
MKLLVHMVRLHINIDRWAEPNNRSNHYQLDPTHLQVLVKFAVHQLLTVKHLPEMSRSAPMLHASTDHCLPRVTSLQTLVKVIKVS